MRRIVATWLLLVYGVAALAGQALHLLGDADHRHTCAHHDADDHESCDHDHHACSADCASHDDAQSADSAAPSIARPGHDSHDCPVCHFLSLSQTSTTYALATIALPRVAPLAVAPVVSCSALDREPYFARGPPAARAA